jgi:hypothetical protein
MSSKSSPLTFFSTLRRETVLKVAEAVGFKEKNFSGKKLAYTMRLEK